MKYIFRILCILAFILPAKAASPSYENFWPHDFITNGAAPGKIRLNLGSMTRTPDLPGDIIKLVGGSNYWKLVGNDLSPTVGTSVSTTNLFAYSTLNAAGALVLTGTLTTNMVAGTNDVSSLGYDVIRVTGFNASTNGSFLRLYAPGNGLGTILVVQNYSAGSAFTMFNNSECAGGDPTMIMRLNGDWTPNRQGESIMLYNYGQGWDEIGRTPTQSITYSTAIFTNVFTTSFVLGGTYITNVVQSLNPTMTYVPYNFDGTVFHDSLFRVGDANTMELINTNNNVAYLRIKSLETNNAANTLAFALTDSDGSADAVWINGVKGSGWGVGNTAARDGTLSVNVMTDAAMVERMEINGTSKEVWFDSGNTLASGNILSVKNNQTNVSDIDYRGMLQLGRATASLFPIHAHAVESVSDAATGEPEDNGFYFKSFSGGQATTMDGGITSTAGTISLGTTSGGDDYAVKISSSSGGLAEVGWFKGSTGYGLLSPFLGVGIPIIPPFWLRAAVDHTTNSIFEITNATTLAFAVKGNSGYTGTGANFLRDDGTYGPAGGGPGADTIWTNFPSATDGEGGTVYGSYLLNPNGDGFVAYAVNYLTNLVGDASLIVSIGHGAVSPMTIATNYFYEVINIGASAGVLMNVSTNGAHDIHNFGNNVGFGSHYDNSGFITSIGSGSAGSAGFTNSVVIFNYGDSSGQSSIYMDSSDIFNYGADNKTQYFTNSTDIFNYGARAGQSRHDTNSTDVYSYGTEAGMSQITGDSSDIYNFGKTAGKSQTFLSKSHIFIIGSGGTATNSNDWVAGDSAYNYFFPGGPVQANSGFKSIAADAAVAIDATGWTNSFGKDAIVRFDGTAITYTVYNNAGTSIYTNAVSIGHGFEELQANGKIIFTAGSGITGIGAPR